MPLSPELLAKGLNARLTGVVISLQPDNTHPNDTDTGSIAVRYNIEVQRSGSGVDWATVEILDGRMLHESGFIYTDYSAPMVTASFNSYRFRQVSDLLGSSSYTNPVIGIPHEIVGSSIPENIQRTAIFAASASYDGLLVGADVNLDYGVGYNDMSIPTPIMYNPQQYSLVHGQSVTFSQPYNVTPQFSTTPNGAITDQTSSLWNNTGDWTGSLSHFNQIRPTGTPTHIYGMRNLSSTGGVAVCLLKIAASSAPTARSDSFGATPCTAVGDTQVCTFLHAPSLSDGYVVNGTCDIDGEDGTNGGSISCTWVVEAFSGGIWNQVHLQSLSATYGGIGVDTAASNSVSFNTSFIYTGLDTTVDDQVRVRLTALTGTGFKTVTLDANTCTYNTAGVLGNDNYAIAATGSLNAYVDYTFYSGGAN